MLRNEGPDGGSSANLPLIIAFDRPIRRLGLSLANGSESTDAELIGLNALGVEVARLSNVAVGSDDEGLGLPSTLEAPEGESIVTAMVDYGAEGRAEEIDEMLLTFEQTPRFRRCIAQFADGVLPNGGGSLRTTVILTNSHNRSQVIRAGFFDVQGNPVDFPAAENGAPPSQIQLGSFNSLVFSSSGTSDPPVEGYACVEGDGPVAAFALYQIFDGGGDSSTSLASTPARNGGSACCPARAGCPGGSTPGSPSPICRLPRLGSQ